jgi:hypothetical protein
MTAALPAHFPDVKHRRTHRRRWQKITTIVSGNVRPSTRRISMRTASAIIIGSITALAVLAAPALARTSDAKKTDDKSTATEASCHSYEQTPEGEWKSIPCQEVGSPARPQQKSAAGKAETSMH